MLPQDSDKQKWLDALKEERNRYQTLKNNVSTYTLILLQHEQNNDS